MRRTEIEHVYNTTVNSIHARRGHRALTGLRIPQLYRAGEYTIGGLLLVYFATRLRQIVRIEELVVFLRRKGLCKTRAPNPRHLGMQYGFYFLVKDCFHPIHKRTLRAGEYCLYSLSRIHPSFSISHAAVRTTTIVEKSVHVTPTSRRATLISQHEFLNLKQQSDNRCRVCGSIEGLPNLKNNILMTRLEMGHCHPLHPLTIDNCIPMCQFCNQMYGNRFVFSPNGTVHSALVYVNTATHHDHHRLQPQPMNAEKSHYLLRRSERLLALKKKPLLYHS